MRVPHACNSYCSSTYPKTEVDGTGLSLYFYDGWCWCVPLCGCRYPSPVLKLCISDLWFWCHTFIYAYLGEKALEHLKCLMSIFMPLRESVHYKSVLKDCVKVIQCWHLFVDLILFDMVDFNVILGMDWLSSYHACIDCFKKEVIFRPPSKA